MHAGVQVYQRFSNAPIKSASPWACLSIAEGRSAGIVVMLGSSLRTRCTFADAARSGDASACQAVSLCRSRNRTVSAVMQSSTLSSNHAALLKVPSLVNS